MVSAPATVPATVLDEQINQQSDLEQSNPVKRIVDEIVALMGDIHDGKEELISYGIPRGTVNMLVEHGVHEKLEEQAALCKSSVDTLTKQFGEDAISLEKLEERLTALVKVQKDFGYLRGIGNQQGLDMTSINYLTMIIRQNLEDGGEKTVNALFSYAMACGMSPHKVEDFLKELTSGPKSVLPDIPRDDVIDVAAESKKRLIRDVLIGCVLGILALKLLT